MRAGLSTLSCSHSHIHGQSEMWSHIVQPGLGLLSSSDPLASASPTARTKALGQAVCSYTPGPMPGCVCDSGACGEAFLLEVLAYSSWILGKD